MKTLSLRKQAELAPKFVLMGQLDGKLVYIADMRSLNDINMTTNIDNATKFSVGFDNPAIKCAAWNMTAKIAGMNVTFNAVNI